MKVYVTGSLAFDRIMPFPGKFADHILPEKIHILNVSFVVNGVDEQFGGTAGNIAYTMSLLGERPVILSQVGKDFAEYEAWLNKHDLSTEGIRTIESEHTAGAYITTDMSDNQITGFNPGAMRHSCEYDMNSIEKDAVGIISPGNVDDMVNHPRFYRENGIKFIFDPGQQTIALGGEKLKECVEGAHMLITNDYELQMIMNATGYSKEEVLSRVDICITTLGEHGCAIIQDGQEVTIPAAGVNQVIDPTGAGDAFRGGLLKGLCIGKNIETACRMGAVAASYSVEKKGVQEHSFTWDEFLKRYEENYGPFN